MLNSKERIKVIFNLEKCIRSDTGQCDPTYILTSRNNYNNPKPKTNNQLERLSWWWLVAVTACAILPTTVLPFVYSDILTLDERQIEVHGVWLVVGSFGTIGFGAYLQAIANRWNSSVGQWLGSAGALISLLGWASGFLFSIFFAIDSKPSSDKSMYAALTVGWLMPLMISLGIFIAKCKRKFF